LGERRQRRFGYWRLGLLWPLPGALVWAGAFRAAHHDSVDADSGRRIPWR